MSGKKTNLSALESRKRLLIAESEINREQLVLEWQATVNGVHSLAAQARYFTSFASAGALLMATVAAFRRNKANPASGKPTWFQTVVKGAKVAASIWLAFRARPKS